MPMTPYDAIVAHAAFTSISSSSDKAYGVIGRDARLKSIQVITNKDILDTDSSVATPTTLTVKTVAKTPVTLGTVSVYGAAGVVSTGTLTGFVNGGTGITIESDGVTAQTGVVATVNIIADTLI